MGEKNSIISLIILLIIFFVVPSLLKLLGQHTLKNKQTLHQDEEEITIEEAEDELESLGLTELVGYLREVED